MSKVTHIYTPMSTFNSARSGIKVNTYLSSLFKHARDLYISFEESSHTYTIKGNNDFVSVTTWNKSHFPQFDADLVIRKMQASKRWESSPYYGMSASEIKAQWKKSGTEASSAGTKLHNDIERFYNRHSVSNTSVEYRYFQNFFHDHQHLEPFRTEWCVYDEELRIAGSVDMVFVAPNGSLLIYDWKRSKKMDKTNRYERATTKCIEHLEHCNFNHYALQLNTYKYIIEKNYGFQVSDLQLVVLHPNNSNYVKYAVPDLRAEMSSLMSLRRKQLLELSPPVSSAIVAPTTTGTNTNTKTKMTNLPIKSGKRQPQITTLFTPTTEARARPSD